IDRNISQPTRGLIAWRRRANDREAIQTTMHAQSTRSLSPQSLSQRITPLRINRYKFCAVSKIELKCAPAAPLLFKNLHLVVSAIVRGAIHGTDYSAGAQRAHRVQSFRPRREAR